jgi:hypothetical protein
MKVFAVFRQAIRLDHMHLSSLLSCHGPLVTHSPRVDPATLRLSNKRTTVDKRKKSETETKTHQPCLIDVVARRGQFLEGPRLPGPR